MTTTPKESPLPFPVRALLGMLVVGAAMLGVTLGARFPDRSGADDRCRTIDAFGDAARGERGSVHIARTGQRYLFADTCELVAVVSIDDERAQVQETGAPTTPTTAGTEVTPPVTERVVTIPPVTAASTTAPPATAPPPTTPPTTEAPPSTAAPDPPAPPTAPEADPPLLIENGGVCVPAESTSSTVYGPGDLVNTANGFGYLVLDGCDLQLVMQPRPAA